MFQSSDSSSEVNCTLGIFFPTPYHISQQVDLVVHAFSVSIKRVHGENTWGKLYQMGVKIIFQCFCVAQKNFRSQNFWLFCEVSRGTRKLSQSFVLNPQLNKIETALCFCGMRYDSNTARFATFLYNERLCKLSNGLLLTSVILVMKSLRKWHDHMMRKARGNC